MNKTSVETRASMCCVGGNFTRKCCFRDPKFKKFPEGMPPELPRRCRHFCFLVRAPSQPLQMSWPRSAHDPSFISKTKPNLVILHRHRSRCALIDGFHVTSEARRRPYLCPSRARNYMQIIGQNYHFEIYSSVVEKIKLF